MHYQYNERGMTYGLGGYFSPDAYFLATIPITLTGHSGNNFHYMINGAFGVQTFQEDSQLFFPLDRGLQSSYASIANGGAPCTSAQTAAHTCAQYPGQQQYRWQLRSECRSCVSNRKPLACRGFRLRQQYEQLQHRNRRILCALPLSSTVRQR